ncbi:uncharacterized protein PITG_17695 [Phytophthora infestans T30-4]|uniref:Uncharacterized protein n=1 Tax=Phytophthora infestans (strain T30-4) TaxID=403677 RepID=D0NYG5_PHYIT|nr:uncharacterized protein PITG_17695 [Phytophthora infestans T30-4]EEY68582.1 hypothetical protein PITG_17695 [Phytophthora infestans T30-4]|eukprot:XP_002997567.1 hypothetical protein PITG_17695 [Phytophthora infestans T30-4]
MAKQCMAKLISEPRPCEEQDTCSNILLILCDLCIRYTSLVDAYALTIALSRLDKVACYKHTGLLDYHGCDYELRDEEDSIIEELAEVLARLRTKDPMSLEEPVIRFTGSYLARLLSVPYARVLAHWRLPTKYMCSSFAFLCAATQSPTLSLLSDSRIGTAEPCLLLPDSTLLEALAKPSLSCNTRSS